MICKINFTSLLPMYSLLYMSRLKAKLKIRNCVQRLRNAKAVTQQELADEIGVTRATINAIERGNYNPSLELSFRLSLFFKKDIKEIFMLEKSK